MQTFLPYPDFVASLGVLDDRRLGKQRVETYQILRALLFPRYAWKNHPAVRMWRGFVPALVSYGVLSCDEWTARGYADTVRDEMLAFTGGVEPDLAQLRDEGRLPLWIGIEALHRTHQSALVRKEPEHYRAYFPDVPDDLPYLWPPDAFPRWPVRRRPTDGEPFEAALTELGFDGPRDGQRAAVDAVLAGRDVLAVTRPGYGGSSTGLLAGLTLPGRTLWLSPSAGEPDEEPEYPAPLSVTRPPRPVEEPPVEAEPVEAELGGAAPEVRAVEAEAAREAATVVVAEADPGVPGHGELADTPRGPDDTPGGTDDTPSGPDDTPGGTDDAPGGTDDAPAKSGPIARPPGPEDLAAVADEIASVPEFVFRRTRDLPGVDARWPALVVVDRAHELDDATASAVVEALGADRAPVLALAAGPADAAVRSVVAARLALRDPAHTGGGYDRPAVHLAVRPVRSVVGTRRAIVEIARGNGPGLVLVPTRARADALAGALPDLGVRAAAFVPGMRASRLADAVSRYRKRKLDALVITPDAEPDLGRIPVRFLVHQEPPADLATLHAQLALADRRGEPSASTVLHTPEQVDGPLAEYLTTAVCRRAVLLDPFGEPVDVPCGRCDVCDARS